MARHDDRDRRTALSFGREAAAYDRGRPGYPDDAVEWALAQAGGQHVSDGRSRHPWGLLDVVDLGAGTGKLTASLLGRAETVTAVEPDPQMRQLIETNLPEAVTLEGTAESLPLPDASADLITVAQAWHWVDVPAASREVARVLRPDGALALIWNVRDETVPWVAALGRVIGSSIAEDYDTVHPLLGEPLETDAYAEFHWTAQLDRPTLHATVASRSYVIAMRTAERNALFAELDDLLDAHPDLAGLDLYPLPYITRVTMARPAR